MHFNSLTRKYIMIVLLLFICIGLIAASFMGKKQDEDFQKAQLLYNQTIQQFQQEDFEGAFATTSTFEQSQYFSEEVNFITGLAAANIGEFEEAVFYFQRVLDLNPHKVEDSMFMLQFAETLVFAQKDEEASLVLERCELLKAPEDYLEYQEKVIQLQEQIASR